MDVYFCRVNMKIEKKDLSHIYDREMIGVHIYDNTGKYNKSNDSKHYSNKAKTTINKLNSLTSEGGWVVVYYTQLQKYRIGQVTPNTKIIDIPSKWSEDYNKLGKKTGDATNIKTVKLTQSKDIDFELMMKLNLISTFPPHHSLCLYDNKNYNNTKNHVNDIFFNKSISINSVKDINTKQLENLCSEFFKNHNNSKYLSIDYLLASVGGNQKDFDIIGYNISLKKTIIAQVTKSNSKRIIQKKLNKLNGYINTNNELIFICPDKQKNNFEKVFNSIIFYSIENIYNAFMKTDIGKSWLNFYK